MVKFIILFVLTFVAVLPLISQETAPVNPDSVGPGMIWEMGFKQRLHKFLYNKQYQVDLEDANSDSDAGKRVWPPFLAELYKVKDEPGKVSQLIQSTGEKLLQSKWAGSFYKPFSMPGYSMYYFQYKDRLPYSQLEHTRRHLYNGNGWEYLTRTDGYMDPIYLPPAYPDGTEFNSENFNWMARMSGYLFAHEYNDTSKITYFDRYVKNWIRALYNVGRVEWNSNNYWGHTFNPLLSLHTNARDPEVKKMAKAGLDWMVAEAAIHYLDGFFAAGDVRAKSSAYKPFAGSIWGYNYLYFTDSLHRPTYIEDFKDKDLKDFIGMTPYATYRPAQVLINIAQRNFNLPVEIHSAKPFYHLDNDNYSDWKGDTKRSGKFEFETIYMDDNYLLVSLASNRPDGRIGTFSEQGLWRLSVKGTDNGARQVIGNSGEMNTMAGRWPYEEIAQYRNIMVRLVKNTDNIWIALPKEINVEFDGDKAFIDMGNGVYMAYISYNAVGKKEGAFKYDPKYNQVSWLFNAKKLGALVLEVGTVRQYGSYKEFKKRIKRGSIIKKADNDIVSYKSPSGIDVKVQYMPVKSYKMHIPLAKENTPYAKGSQVINPAGVTPKLWGNGKLVVYEKWNSYEVDFGDSIIDQKWGSGILMLQAGGIGLKIKIDAVTSQVSYYTFDSKTEKARLYFTGFFRGSRIPYN